MEHFNRTHSGAYDENRISSVSSNDSGMKQSYSEYAESIGSTRSRPISIIPSYMNANVPKRKPVVPKSPISIKSTPTTPLTPSAPLATALLLLAIAAEPHLSTIPYLKMMLRRHRYSGIVLLGSAEHATRLKQIKMDIYALLGQLGQEVSLQMEMQENWAAEETSRTVSKVTDGKDPIQGVLCSPEYASDPGGSEILDIDEGQLDRSWKSSVAFLHTIAKSTLPNFRHTEHKQNSVSGLFLMTSATDLSPMSAVYKAGCDTLLKQLAESSAVKNVTVDHAENVLIPELEPAEETNGNANGLTAAAVPLDPAPDDYQAPPESPTKLWNMWALQMGAND